jgi:hypothetical protein
MQRLLILFTIPEHVLNKNLILEFERKMNHCLCICILCVQAFLGSIDLYKLEYSGLALHKFVTLILQKTQSRLCKAFDYYLNIEPFAEKIVSLKTPFFEVLMVFDLFIIFYFITIIYYVNGIYKKFIRIRYLMLSLHSTLFSSI